MFTVCCNELFKHTASQIHFFFFTGCSPAEIGLNLAATRSSCTEQRSETGSESIYSKNINVCLIQMRGGFKIKGRIKTLTTT